MAQAGCSTDSLLEELAAAGLAQGPPAARIGDYRGGALRDALSVEPLRQQPVINPTVAPAATLGASAAPAADARPPLDPAAYPPPSAAGLRQALTALCVLPLTSAAVRSRRACQSQNACTTAANCSVAPDPAADRADVRNRLLVTLWVGYDYT